MEYMYPEIEKKKDREYYYSTWAGTQGCYGRRAAVPWIWASVHVKVEEFSASTFVHLLRNFHKILHFSYICATKNITFKSIHLRHCFHTSSFGQMLIHMSHIVRKPVLSYIIIMRTTKPKISQHIHAVWSVPLLFAA